MISKRKERQRKKEKSVEIAYIHLYMQVSFNLMGQQIVDSKFYISNAHNQSFDVGFNVRP